MTFDWKQFYLTSDGRIDRKQWWLRLTLPLIVITIILFMIDNATGHYNPETGIALFTDIFSLIALIPSIMVHIKRFHDRDKSGWWVLIGLVPIIGGLWLLIELGFLSGTAGPNRFGPPVIGS